MPKQLLAGATWSQADSTMHWAAEISAGQPVSRSAADRGFGDAAQGRELVGRHGFLTFSA